MLVQIHKVYMSMFYLESMIFVCFQRAFQSDKYKQYVFIKHSETCF